LGQAVKDKWYGDKRDLVKWGTLIHLCKKQGLLTIIQVAFLRPEATDLILETNHGQVEVPAEVWKHFRDVNRVQDLGQRSGLEVEIVANEFNPSERGSYLKEVLAVVEHHADRSKVVLLDPDTGIEPSRATAEHVTRGEVSAVWKALDQGDWLVLYQHAARSGTRVEARRTKFAEACGMRNADTYRSNISKDVALFATRKP
jgi:hypothetical protein